MTSLLQASDRVHVTMLLMISGCAILNNISCLSSLSSLFSPSVLALQMLGQRSRFVIDEDSLVIGVVEVFPRLTPDGAAEETGAPSHHVVTAVGGGRQRCRRLAEGRGRSRYRLRGGGGSSGGGGGKAVIFAVSPSVGRRGQEIFAGSGGAGGGGVFYLRFVDLRTRRCRRRVGSRIPLGVSTGGRHRRPAHLPSPPLLLLLFPRLARSFGFAVLDGDDDQQQDDDDGANAGNGVDRVPHQSAGERFGLGVSAFRETV